VSAYAAIDLGAGSGRVVVGRLRGERIELEVVHRFANQPRAVAGHERWDVAGLFDGIRAGLARVAAAGTELRSLGVDTWGVDYALLDERGALLEDPVCYRDDRTAGAIAAVRTIVPDGELFARTGVQQQPFNTLYQLFAQRCAGAWPARAARLLLMPDLFHFLLTGARTSERTIASTTQLLNAQTRAWDGELLARLDLPADVFGPLIEPGTVIGRVRAEHGLPPWNVVAPAAHDTASAVAGAPLRAGFAFLSSGTWSLLGVETPAPVLGEAARSANLTNEAGAGGRNRLLANIMGLWILEECRREWGVEHEALLADVARAPAFAGVIQPDDACFFHPSSMGAAVRSFLEETSQTAPSDPGTLARIVLESLALRYASVVDALERASGQRIGGVHVIGGGSRNTFLNQATADACGRPVLAGPDEATALGNVLVQAIAAGAFADLAQARACAARSVAVREFAPRATPKWDAARARFARLQ
jgi:rhamnulokinase